MRLRYAAASMTAMVLLGVGPALAQTGNAPSITVGLQPSTRPEIADIITAQVTDESGSAMGNVVVEYWVATDVFGPRFAFVGEALTDATGIARLPFEPHRELYEVRVTFDGDEARGPAEATAQLRFRTERVVQLVVDDPTQLGGLRFVMPRLMGIVVGLIWIMLIGLGWTTLRGIKAGVPDAHKEPKPAIRADSPLGGMPGPSA